MSWIIHITICMLFGCDWEETDEEESGRCCKRCGWDGWMPG